MFTVWTTRVSNPVCSSHFRASASVSSQQTAFATGILPDIYAFHRYTWNSICLSRTQEGQFRKQLLRLSRTISLPTHPPAYTPFTPSESGQRLHPPYYAAAGTELAGAYFGGTVRTGKTSLFVPPYRGLQCKAPSSLTRRCCVRLASIAQYSSLLPPIGVWAVSQSQCG